MQRFFFACVARDEPPLVTGEDGRIVLEAIDVTYRSAGAGRAVDLPLRPVTVATAIDCWLGPAQDGAG